ncbi:MAG: hypothetical protein JW787_06530 [Sedimentisphaerales bacterium]|nr:hypothetical protein [Sedimentisphaerales bacterium]
MAAITFTLEEILQILKSNNRLPEQIVRSEVKNDCIEFTVDTKMFLLPVIPVSLKYISYENNIATFELSIVGSHFNKALSMVGNSYQSKLPEYVKLDLPNVLIDLQKLFEHRKIKGIHVKEIIQNNSNFTIITG